MRRKTSARKPGGAGAYQNPGLRRAIRLQSAGRQRPDQGVLVSEAGLELPSPTRHLAASSGRERQLAASSDGGIRFLPLGAAPRRQLPLAIHLQSDTRTVGALIAISPSRCRCRSHQVDRAVGVRADRRRSAHARPRRRSAAPGSRCLRGSARGERRTARRRVHDAQQLDRLEVRP